jgi:acetylornithine deacetylase/succinyl-diaminopimelate desuccinylase-like protein
MTPEDQALDQFVESRLSGYVQEIMDLCRQPSISARGEGAWDCAELLATIFRRHLLETQILETPGNPVVVARGQGQSPRTLLFYNHYDVQPPEPLELWTTPPFEPHLRDGCLFARGARDDKGEIVARLAAMDAARTANNGQLPCGITFVTEGEEEIGSPNIGQFVLDHAALLKSHAAIWEEGGTDGDGRPYTNLGCRGLLYVELSAQTLNADAHSGGAHILPNAAWRLLRALASLKGPDERILIEGFYENAEPPTPAEERLIAAMPASADKVMAQYGAKNLVNGLTGIEINRALFNPTCNIAGLTAGFQGPGLKTIIPASASAKVDFRLVPRQTPQDIFHKLRRHLDDNGFSDVVANELAAVFPYKAPAQDPFVELTARAGESAYGLPYQMSPSAGGTSPIYAFAHALGDIPVVTAGVGNGNTNRSHAPDEHVRLVDFQRAAGQIARIILGFGKLARDLSAAPS